MEYNSITISPVAVIHTPFKEKFGIPRQSGLSESLIGRIVFLPQYRNKDAIREIEQFSHLWLIFDFTLAHKTNWSPTVRPPRLGGNTRVGVFASRSPFRPNPLGLSSVKLERIEDDKNDGSVLVVSGIDILDGTPIYDIKPYIPYSDCHYDAKTGYSVSGSDYRLTVCDPDNKLVLVDDETDRKAIIDCISDDPRPSYQNDPDRIYYMTYKFYNIGFYIKCNYAQIITIKKLFC